MNQKSLPLRGHLYAFISMILWSSSFIFSRQILAWLDPKATMALRFTAVVITAVLFCLILRIRPPKLRDLPLFFAGGLTGFTIYMILFHEGMVTVDSATGSLLLAIVPLFTALLAQPLYGETLSPLSWGGVLLSLSGLVLLIILEGGISADPGIFMLVGSSLSGAAYALIQRRLLKDYAPMAVSFYSMIIGGLLLQVFLPPAIPQILASPPQAWAIVLYMGIFPGVVGYAVWCKALSMAPHTNDVTNYLFTGPAIATVMAYFIGGEVPTLPTILGGVITVAGLLLFCYAKSREAKQEKLKLQEAQAPVDAQEAQVLADIQEAQVPVDTQEPQVPVDTQEAQVHEDTQEAQAPEDTQYAQVPEDTQEMQAPADAQETQVQEDTQEPQAPEDTQEPQVPEDTQEIADTQEVMA